jgi:small multidrug resistance pump
MSSAGLVLLKLGGENGAPISIVNGKAEFNLGFYAISGIFLYAVSFIIYTYLVSKNDLGYIIPVSTALVYIFIFAASYFIFKEAITAMKVVGIFLILGGVILLNLSK